MKEAGQPGSSRIFRTVRIIHDGFARPRAIRQLIERHMHVLERFGICPTVGLIPDGRGRPGTEYHLNEEQAIYIVTQSDTPRAGAEIDGDR